MPRLALMAACLFGLSASAALAADPSLEGTWQAKGDGLLHPLAGAPPLKPKYRAIYESRRAAFLAADPKVDPARRCKPPGEPRLTIDPATPFEIVETAPRVLFLYQWNRLVRMVEIGAPRDVVGPVYFGQNAGKWDGGSLVVDVQALHPGIALDKSGLPHGDGARLTERFTRTGPDSMALTVHVDDPEVYARPWDAKVSFARVPGGHVKEDICLDREGLIGKLKESDDH